jgi:diguanylate cyclase (GGDEF)-like protein
MSRRNAPSRAITIGGGILAVAGLAVALTLNVRYFTPFDWIAAGCGGIAVCIVALNAVPVRGLRMKSTGITAEAIVLDLPIALALIALGGTVGLTASGLALAFGYGFASLGRGSRHITDLPRHGVLRILAILCCFPFAADLIALQALPEPRGTLIAAGAVFAATLAFTFGISTPASAFTFRVSILRIWERIIRDPRTMRVLLASILWTIVVRAEVLQHHLLVVLSMWLAVVVCAVLLRTIDKQHAELHRLRLVRDAVQAMLGERDPLPQINAILGTLRVPSQNETVCVLAATGARTETWRMVTTLGPPLSSAGDELRRRILARLKFSGSPTTTLKDGFYTVYAFAARLADGELHGGLVVHRRNDRPLSGEQISQFTNAAFELAPLLRDMRTISATQSAASIDGLTGLANRATTMDHLQTMIDHATIAENGAVLLLDIDHFKFINDQLGHAAGDECLRKIGEIVKKGVRGGDTAGRIGGEEFLVVMPGATGDVALTVAERLRLAIALGGMRHGNGEPVTTSIGVAAVRAGDTIELLLARADRGLYEAKRLGRNRTVEDLESA